MLPKQSKIPQKMNRAIRLSPRMGLEWTRAVVMDDHQVQSKMEMACLINKSIKWAACVAMLAASHAPAVSAAAQAPSVAKQHADLCKASVDAAKMFGLVSYSCYARPLAKTFRFEYLQEIDMNTLKPKPNPKAVSQTTLFWAGMIGFSLSARKDESMKDWIYEARTSDDLKGCASIDGAKAAALASQFGADKTKMGTPAFSAKAWPQFKVGPCGSANATPRGPLTGAPKPMDACAAIAAGQGKHGLKNAGRCENNPWREVNLYVSSSKSSYGAQWDFDVLSETLMVASAVLPADKFVYLPERESIEPSNCIKIKVGDYAGLGQILKRAGANPKDNLGGSLPLIDQEAASLKKLALLFMDVGPMGHAFPDKNFESARAPCPGYESYNKLLIEHGTVAPSSK